MNELIRKYALQNAVQHKGKASENAVIGMLFSEKKDLDRKTIATVVKRTVLDVNSLSFEEQKRQLFLVAPQGVKRPKKERDILSNLKLPKPLVTCFPPEPSKYLHLGHAKALLLNYEIAKRNKGKFIFRFEDTNPSIVKKEYYSQYLSELSWLGIKPTKITYASSQMDKFYNVIKKMLKSGQAYVCFCSSEEIRLSREEGICCSCHDDKGQVSFFDELAKKGDGVIRLKGDLTSQNTTLRDPTLFRVILEKHPLLGKKYRLWPTYDFETAIMDGLEKVTFRVRSKEFELRSELHNLIQSIAGFSKTIYQAIGRLNLDGVPSSGRIIREKISSGELIGWDDTTLTTLEALRRRGFCAEAIKNFVLNTGISKAESTLSWGDLIMQNKRLLDRFANRYFFVASPKKVTVLGAHFLNVRVPLHPNDSKMGVRLFKTTNKFYVADALEDRVVYRFMHLFNFKDKRFITTELDSSLGAKLIHWLPVCDDLVKVSVMMPDKGVVSGLGEKAIKKIKVGEVIQFERFGFCRLDKKEKMKYSFWFTHR